MVAKYALALAIALAAAGGCSSDSKDMGTQPAHVEAQASKLPAVVLTGVQNAFPGAAIQHVEKEEYEDGTVHWEVELLTADGKKIEREFDTAGKLLPEH